MDNNTNAGRPDDLGGKGGTQGGVPGPLGEVKAANTSSSHDREIAKAVEAMKPPVPAIREVVLCSSEVGEIPKANESSNFMQSLIRFFKTRYDVELGGPGWKFPRLGGGDLNIPMLYSCVLNNGGFEKVTEIRGSWKNIAELLNVPTTITNAAYMLRNHYEKFLLDYEQKYWGLGTYNKTKRSEAAERLSQAAAMKSRVAGRSHIPDTIRVTPPSMSVQDAHQLAVASAQKAATTDANRRAQGMFDKIAPSMGPYMVIPPNFEISHWDEIMKALNSQAPEAIAWSLNVLAILAHDAKHEMRVSKLPGLLEALLNIVNVALVELPVGAKISEAFSEYSSSNSHPQYRQRPAKQSGGSAQQSDKDSEYTSWWWDLESEGVVAPDDGCFHRSMAGVAAIRVIRNLSFTRSNMNHFASTPFCVHCLTNCLSLEVIERLGTDGEEIRFSALDTLSNMGASMSLPKLGMVGKALMQSISVLLGAPVMGDEELDPEVTTKSAVLSADLLSQLSLGTENVSVIATEASRTGLYAWLSAHLKSKDPVLVTAAVSALSRLISLPGPDTTNRIIHQRWALRRLVELATSVKDGVPQAAIFEAASALKAIAASGHGGREALAQHETRISCAAMSEAKQSVMLSRVLAVFRNEKSKKQKM